MNDQDIDRLLEEGFSSDSPGPVFRARVLLDCTAALARRRRIVRTWRLAALAAAAVVIAAISFLLGRSSVGPRLLQPVAEPVVADAGDTVVVPKDLLACLSAARLFRQLGMEDRMNRALDCAGRLLPREAIGAGGATGPVFFAAVGDGIDSRGRQMGSGPKPGAPQSVDSMNRVLAGFLGGYDHASATD
jgi:hypothetical protein